MPNDIYKYNEEKLKCAIKYLGIENKHIANSFGISEGQASKLTNFAEGRLKKLHLHAFADIYNIPLKIFTDNELNTETKIIEILDNEVEKKEGSIFLKDEELFSNIVGKWYAYFHPSNTFADIYCIETIINPDHTVSDQNGNHGELLMSERQSIIVKKSKNSKNLVSITFDNDQVAYHIFPFSMVSKTNQVNREMCTFGFYSRKKIDLNIAKKILGEEVKRVQIKMDCDFKERVVAYGLMESGE